MASDEAKEKPSFLQSTYPVQFPSHSALTLPEAQFNDFLRDELANVQQTSTSNSLALAPGPEADDSITLVSAPSSTSGLGRNLAGLEVTDEIVSNAVLIERTQDANDHGTISNDDTSDMKRAENKMLTENKDVAYRSTTSSLVDLFFELEEVVSGTRLRDLLIAAWKEDSPATLKIIFNARSIHIGKASRSVFYRCAGWLAMEHPLTLLTNLEWLARPTIKKKSEEKTEDSTAPQVSNSVAHGYYKDLLNLLVLAINDKLNVLADPREVLNIPSAQKKDKDKKKNKKRGRTRNTQEKTTTEEVRTWDAKEAKIKRHTARDSRHSLATNKFEHDRLYKTLHVTVARIFASQLTADLALLGSTDTKNRRSISLCAKWAPSHNLFHDKHTFIVSSIAEILYPQSEFENVSDRRTYLLHAREAYRKDVSALRKALGIVEREIGAQTFSNIKYSHVPSLAMDRYKSLFARKDSDHFIEYLSEVGKGQQSISGAVLLPSTLVKQVRHNRTSDPIKKAVDCQVVDGQWKTLVQRIRDSGTISSSIAVCDVSASMLHPKFSDGTVPMETAIGLSLLIAEVTAPPFGGHFITFSTQPMLEKIDLKDSLHDKVLKLSEAHWDMSTDFVAVFEKLILPRAKLHRIKPEDMVKRIFVFSDMQFDRASDVSGTESWSSSFERIEKEFEKCGYELPQIVFWNLAGGRAGYLGRPTEGDPTAPKPVTSDQNGTALVSGYSQGLLKVFLENGDFEELEEAIEEEVVEAEIPDDDNDDSDVEKIVLQKRKKVKLDPLITVKKAISHEAYSMLSVVD